jgi:hypothetical protein
MSESKTKPGAGPGCFAIVIALFSWFVAAHVPSSRRVSIDWWEIRLYESFWVGALAAVALGIGLWAARACRPRWVGLIAVVLGSALVAHSIAKIARWL